MTHQFDPRTMLKQSSLPLLHQFFEQRRELLDLPWEELKAHRRFDLIYHAWQALPDTQRRQVQAIFQDLWELADDRGLRSFVEELQAASPQTCWEFTACRTKLNKVLWMYIYHPKLLEKAALFVRADGLSRSRYAVRRNSLPKQPITVTPEVLNALAAALRDYYWSNEMRGRHCQVEHYTRSGGIRFLGDYSLIARTGRGRKWQVHVSKTGVLGLQFNGGRCERPKSIFELLARMQQPEQPADDSDDQNVTVAALFKKLDDQGHRCAISGREITVDNVELDHIQARADEGLHRLDNVHLVVRDVNRAKGRMDLEKFIVLCNDVARTHPRPVLGNANSYLPCM